MRFLGGLLLLISTLSFGQEYIGADGPTFEVEEGLRDSTPPMGLVLPDDWGQVRELKIAPMYEGDLPEKFDWRDKGLTKIVHQGNCGSCWSFSAAATLSDVYKLHTGIHYDLSEQYWVDCAKGSYGCSGGWYHDVFKMVKPEGTVTESQWPYKAKDQKCPSGLTYGWKIKGYSELASGVADPETIKRAIYTYGPLAVAVSVAGRFSSYSGGIYNESSAGTVNHAVNLVGWDDTASVPHWIMRNSWGESWGENGYMKIAYGSRKIGYAATYVDYNGPIPHDGPVPPEPTPEPTPDPCPPCPECTFWTWFKSIFS